MFENIDLEKMSDFDFVELRIITDTKIKLDEIANELSELNAFMDSQNFKNFSNVQQQLISIKYYALLNYHHCLHQLECSLE